MAEPHEPCRRVRTSPSDAKPLYGFFTGCGLLLVGMFVAGVLAFWFVRDFVGY
jgi:hypothetical protein